MSMNQTAIMSFLNKPRNRVMLDTSYTYAFGKTPGKVATMMRHDPDIITGGVGMSGTALKTKAHAAALRALVREKQVAVKVLHEKGASPMVIITKRNTRGKDEEVQTEVPRKKRKYTRRKGIEVKATETQTENPVIPTTPETPETPVVAVQTPAPEAPASV